MRMFFRDDEMVTIVYGKEIWEIKKQLLADYLTGDLSQGSETVTLEKAVILTYLPFTTTIHFYKGNHIKILNMKEIEMEVSNELKDFLISSK